MRGIKLPSLTCLILYMVSWCLGQETSRIIGGTEVRDGEAPWQVALERVSAPGQADFICGGCWIANRTVITAAHCVFGLEDQPERFQIHFNTVDLNGGSTMAVRRVIMHPAFTRRSLDWDLAILVLEDFLVPDVNAGLVEIASQEPEPGDVLLTTGWGQTEVYPNKRAPPSFKLLKTNLITMKWDQCEETWREEWPVLTANMFCATSISESSTCHGDSGGPVISHKTGQLVGLVSWGDKFCGTTAQTPNVFTNLVRSEILTWIEVNLFN